MPNLELATNRQFVERHSAEYWETAQLFSSALAAGRRRQLWAALTRRPNALRRLSSDPVRAQGSHFAGLMLVPIEAIRGSEGRTGDFDDQLHPLSDQTRVRWQSVARAIAAGTSLPPVELIRVGQSYYVRDGHHRVSVARAMGAPDIEAQVTVWTTGA